MFGKLFASLYSGSLFGKPAIVFAVWCYAIANLRPRRGDGECFVEINPVVLAATFATTPEAVDEALVTLESPDPGSRNKREEGRRLVLLGEGRPLGPRQYRVVNGAAYRAIRDEDERREQNRRAQRAHRERVSNVSAVSQSQPESAQVEVEVEVEGKKNARRDRGSRVPIPFEVTDEMREWAARAVPTIDVDRATASFVDYWRGVPGAKGRKCEWPATWQNSLRRDAEIGKNLRRSQDRFALVPFGGEA